MSPARRCPRCDEWLFISCDMWGQYYACEECGFAAEEEELDGRRSGLDDLLLQQEEVARPWRLAERR